MTPHLSLVPTAPGAGAGTDPASPAPSGRPAARAVALLAAHVPLTLLLDLADPRGPQSRDLLRAEAGTAHWLVA